MGGRRLGSAGLRRAATYVADAFQRLGLASHIQEFPLVGSTIASYEESGIQVTAPLLMYGKRVLEESGRPARVDAGLSFARDAWFVVDTVLENYCGEHWGGSRAAGAAVLSGRYTPTTARAVAATLPEGAHIYVPPTGTDSATRAAVLRAFALERNMVVPSDEDAASFSRRHTAAAARPPVVIEWQMESRFARHRCVAYAAPDALTRPLARAGLDLVALRRDTVPRVRQMPGLQLRFWVAPKPRPDDTPQGLNVIATLRGADSMLVDPIVVTAHLDAGSTVSAAGETNDNVAGVAGLLALAQAFAQSGAAPKRPVVFLASSANAPYATGVRWAVQEGNGMSPYLAIVLKTLGNGPADSLYIDGVSDLALPTSPSWTAASHSELKLALADGGTAPTSWPDNVGFVTLAIPTLALHGGRSASAISGADADQIDTALAARRLRLVYHLVYDLADPRPVRWTAAGRKHRAALLGP